MYYFPEMIKNNVVLTKQVFIALFSFSGSLTTQYVSLSFG